MVLIKKKYLNLGFAKPMFLQSGSFHENDGNHENDEDNSIVCRFVRVRSSQTRAWGREFVHVCFCLLGFLVQVGANLDGLGAVLQGNKTQRIWSLHVCANSVRVNLGASSRKL